MDPDFQLCGLSVWVKSRLFPDNSSSWDGNWLMVRARMESTGATVTAEGPLLMTNDLERFRTQLETMNESLTGEASLHGYEPNLRVTLGADGLGHISGEVEITPDHLSECHRFDIWGFDQTYLPALIHSLDRILERFPIIEEPDP